MSILAVPNPLVAQQIYKIKTIGFLGFGPATAYASHISGLRTKLRELGYVEGRNIVFEFRWADNNCLLWQSNWSA